MLLIELILIYIGIINIYYYNKRIQKDKLEITGVKQHNQSVFILFLFFLYFVCFVRLMSLFREHQIIDIKYFFLNYSVVFFFSLLFALHFLRRNMFFIVKNHWYRLHYFWMHKRLGGINYFHPHYDIFFHKYFCVYIYKLFPWIKYYSYFFSFLILILIVRDIYVNEYILDNSLYYLTWFSLFKFCYNIAYYIEYKYSIILEYHMCNSVYSFWADLDRSNFQPGGVDFLYFNLKDKMFSDMVRYRYNVVLK